MLHVTVRVLIDTLHVVLLICSCPHSHTQGISYDHVELRFFLNGKSLDCSITGIRGTVYPVFYGKYFANITNALTYWMCSWLLLIFDVDKLIEPGAWQVVHHFK